MNRLHGIQYLRAVAAIAVVVFHAAERTGGHFVIGAAGVDVFFVISGFIMWVISERRPTTPARFMRDRLQRIAPVYWVATGIMIAGALAGLFPNLKLTLGHILGSLFFIPHQSPSNGQVWPVLVQGWTLNYEIFFYVVFAACLLLPSRFRLAGLALVLLGLAGVGFVQDSGNPIVATYTDPIILEFLLGALVGKLWLDGRIPLPATGTVLIVAALLGFAIVGTTHVGFGPLSFGPLAAALLIGVLALEKAGAVRHLRPMLYLGDASYSIYLFHTFAISVVAKLAALLAMPAAAAMILAVVAGVTIGTAAYEMLEKPMIAVFKGSSSRKRARKSVEDNRPVPESV
ncbi:acyltransferase family protein [Arvimicrobium flavum]|uniref:acyltransferase family protein n=1 Tax=Arvimicrobium flavum TaxID=3393320 RepID=UPI00237A4A7F|nr:acyltransferase [Mesorhizobium shangrilense]